MNTFRDLPEEVASKVAVGPSAHGKLMSVVNEAGILLDGIVFGPPNPRLAIVHVHGSLGNFYQQPFLRVFANRLGQHGIALLAFNLTAHDGLSEGYSPDQEMQYIGGSLSRFETCLDDLDALLRFARSICPTVALQGHSLGCDRVLFYAQQRARDIPLILLSPCDSHHLQEIWLGSETISEQVVRLIQESENDEAIELLPAREYGLSGPDGWTYSIPVTKDVLLSIITGPVFQILRLDKAAINVSNAPSFVYLGGEDAIRGSSISAMKKHLHRLVPRAQINIVEHGDHSLDGCEENVAKLISEWASGIGLLTGNRTDKMRTVNDSKSSMRE